MKKIFTLLLLCGLSTSLFAQDPFTIDQLAGKNIGGGNKGMGSSFRTPTAGNLTYVTVTNRSTLGDAVNSTLEIFKGNTLNPDSLIYQESFIVNYLYSNKRISIKLSQPLALSANKPYTFYIKGFALTYTITNTYPDGTLWNDGSEDPNYDLGFILHFNTPEKEMSLSNTSVNENSPVGHEIGTLSISNTTNPVTYTLIRNGKDSQDTSSFSIEGNKLLVKEIPDYKAQTSYKLRILAIADNIAVEKEFEITVNNLIEAPTNFSLSKNTVSENNNIGAIIGNFSATDPEKETLTYSLVPNAADNEYFTLTNNQLKINITTDFETKNTYTVRAKVTSQTGESLEKDFIINVTDVNEAPTEIMLSNTSVVENNLPPTVIGFLAAIDPDQADKHTFSLPANELDNESFFVDGSTLSIIEVANYKHQNQYNIKVKVSDQGGLSYEQFFTIQVQENPTTNVLNRSAKTIQMYPNPAKDNVSIIIDEPAFISIHSLSGNVVKEWYHNSNTVSIEDIPAGLYLVKITRNNEVETLKLTIE